MNETRRSTDYGTVILHALLIVTFVVLMATGLRIATDDPDAQWLAALDPILPVGNLWFHHLIAGAALAAVLAGYACYIWLARLTTRVQLDKARFLAILRPGRTRWAALNVVVYWVLIGALVTEVVTGVLLFAGGGKLTLAIHLDATFACLGAVLAHVGLHAANGGIAQLLRIARPGPLHLAQAPPDLAELLAEQLARNAASSAAGKPSASTAEPGQQRPAPRPMTLNSHPFGSALIVASVVCGVAIGAEQTTRPTLQVVEIGSSEMPTLDGDLSDPAWTKAKPAFVLTTQGGDFGGNHQSMVEIRALHDDQYAYFAFVWEDPTRSLKHHPLIKRDGRWHVAASRADLVDEAKYHEDKFAVLLTHPGLPLIGAAIHLARQPLTDMPPSSTGRGLHYTVDGSIADVWQWRASHGGPTGHIDNCHFGGPETPAAQSPAAKAHYAGGFALDPGFVPYQSNFVEGTGQAGASGLLPRRLPRDLAAMTQALGRISDGPGESESEDSRWWMTAAESVPYAAALDAKIANGTVIPGILIPDGVKDTGSSIRGTARWAAGRWTLELARQLHTGSRYDIPIKSGVLMWVAAFDHAEKRHTRHLRPFRLEVK
jgi:hypothetical protein